jgi:hypothetical protein
LDILDLAKVLRQSITDARERGVLGRYARRAVRCPAYECGIVHLGTFSQSEFSTAVKAESAELTFDHSGWWFFNLHCNETAVMKSWALSATFLFSFSLRDYI